MSQNNALECSAIRLSAIVEFAASLNLTRNQEKGSNGEAQATEEGLEFVDKVECDVYPNAQPKEPEW